MAQERMYEVKLLAEEEPCKFEQVMQEYLDKGYEICSTNCGVINEPEGYSRTIYQAILVKGE